MSMLAASTQYATSGPCPRRRAAGGQLSQTLSRRENSGRPGTWTATDSQRLGSKAYYGGVGISDKAVVRFNLASDDRRYPVETVYKDAYERFRRLRIDRFEVDVRGDFYDNELDTGEDFTRASMDVIQRLTFDAIRDAGRSRGASASAPGRVVGSRPPAAGQVGGYAGPQRDATKGTEGQHAGGEHEATGKEKASTAGRGLPDVIEASGLRTWFVTSHGRFYDRGRVDLGYAREAN